MWESGQAEEAQGPGRVGLVVSSPSGLLRLGHTLESADDLRSRPQTGT